MKKTVFIVDDCETTLRQAKEVLDDHYKILTMTSADKMFDMLGKLTPNLILLDLEMPGTDGFVAMKRLQQNKNFSSVPVIFFTSHCDEEIEAQCFEIGAADFISKPFTSQGLLQRVRSQLNIRELIKERGNH